MYFLKYLSGIVFVLILACSFGSCTDELFTNDPDKVLAFSTDTLTFDTVFTTTGSTTEKFIVYNPNNRALKISSVSLAGGASSQFRINVDGSRSANNSFSNIEISAHDSMYVFVEVTVDPNNVNSPVLVNDSIIFSTNGTKQQVRLEAYGQDMILFKNKTIHNDTTLRAGKPYLIQGYLANDSAKTLTLSPGCKLYFHNNAYLQIRGNLKAEGSFEQPIEMRGDRLDKVKFMNPVPYNYVAGQWGGIYLLWAGGRHTLKHVNVTSAYVGLYVPNSNMLWLPDLTVSYCRLHNFVYYGIVAQNCNLQVDNTEISNTGSVSVYLNGGNHKFTQTTVANFYDNNSFEPGSRDKNPAVLIMNLYKTAPMYTTFENCVIAGGIENEFAIASRFMAQYKGTFTNTYIRRATKYDSEQFSSVRWSAAKDTVFKYTRFDYEKNRYFDFTPDSVSPLRGLADKTIATKYPLDLNGNKRLTDNAPDAGAYEWMPTK
jgi:hypothetical protein